MLGNEAAFLTPGLLSIPKAYAQDGGSPTVTAEVPKLGLIALLVENELLNDTTQYETQGERATLTERILAFAQHVQDRVPHSKVLVIGIAPEDTPFKIATVLEKFYYQGDGENDNRLVGTILVGDVPVPVVYNREKKAIPSLYPYTDFYRKRFVYNHGSGRYEFNADFEDGTPEIWHGVIRSGKEGEEGRQELANYFYKNDRFSQGDANYSSFNSRLFYAHFPGLEKHFNLLDYRNYKHFIRYFEEMVYNRYNKNILWDLIKIVSGELGQDVMPETAIYGDPAIKMPPMPDNMTDFVFKKYAYGLEEALKSYLGQLNQALEITGRWGVNQIDTPQKLIALRDAYIQQHLKEMNTELENAIYQEISNRADPLQVLSQVTLNTRIKKCNYENSDPTQCGSYVSDDGYEGPFVFNTRLSGRTVGGLFDGITKAEECGLMTGQRAPAGTPTLENNSVLVEANRMDNPDTQVRMVENDNEKDEIEDLFSAANERVYNRYGGCVYNNANQIKIDEVSLGRWRCVPDEADVSVFDIKGSREIPADQFNPGGAGRCSPELMSYRWNEWDEEDSYADNRDKFFEINSFDEATFRYTVNSDGDTITIDLDDEDLFGERNNNNTGGYVDTGATDDSVLMGTLLWKAYESLKSQNLITPLSGANEGHIEKRANAVLKYMVLSNKKIYLKPSSRNIFFELSIDKAYKSIFGVENHVEPTPEHYAEIKGSFTTPSTPADGIRYVKFNRGGSNKEFQYLNLFRIPGKTLEEISANFYNAVIQKDAELNQMLGVNLNLHAKYFLQNPQNSVLNSILWRQLSLDEKHKKVLQAPFELSNKAPNGYEVMHIVAEGDSEKFEFGINAKLENKEAKANKALGITDEDEEETGGQATGSATEESSGSSYQCGDPCPETMSSEPVSIIDWPCAVGCWVQSFTKLEGLFSLDNSCSGVAVPTPKPKEEDLLKELQADPLQTPAIKVKSIDLIVPRKTVTPGETVPVELSVRDENGKLVIGYQPDRAVFSLGDSSLGTFEKNNMPVYVGVAKTNLKIGQTEGSTLLTVKLGSFTKTVELTVKKEVKVALSKVREDQGSLTAYRIHADLVDSSGARISNIDTTLGLTASSTFDGTFAEPQIHLIEGRGSTLFFPNPVISKTEVKAVGGGYVSSPLVVENPVGQPRALQIKVQEKIGTNETGTFEVRAVDATGRIAPHFSGTVSVTVPESDQEFISLSSSTVTLTGGVGAGTFKTGIESDDVKLKASVADLKPASADLKIRTQILHEDVDGFIARSLVASLAGFAAGDVQNENAFGNQILFSGKTEAVVTSITAPTPPEKLSIEPNYKITLHDSRFLAEMQAKGETLELRVNEKETLTPVLETEIPMDFTRIHTGPINETLETGVAYLNINNTSFKTLQTENGYEVRSEEGVPLLALEPQRFQIIDPEITLILNVQSQEAAPELLIRYGNTALGRVILNFAPRSLDATTLNVAEAWKTKPVYGGNKIQDPQGLALYSASDKVPDDQKPAEDYGFKGDNNYLLLFAGGTPLGEAVRFELPESGILLGDPTLTLNNRSRTSLNYDSTVGRKLFKDINDETVAAITEFDFNADGKKDAAVVLKDGRVRLFEAGPTDPPYIDRGDIGFLADGALSIVPFDFRKDGYEDLLVATNEGRLAILDNNQEKITRTDHQLKVGKKLYQLLKYDMDADGFEDLITLDSRGEIRIFYNQNNELPTEGERLCQDSAETQCSYGFSIDPAKNLKADTQFRYAGMEEPSHKIDSQPVTTFDDFDPDVGGIGIISKEDSIAFVEDLKAKAEAARQNPVENSLEIPTLPWVEGDETQTYFAPAADVPGLSVTKTVSNKDRPGERSLDLEENLLYTISIRSSQSRSKVTIADTVPDVLSANVESAQCEGGCSGMQASQNDIYLFFTNLDLEAGKTYTITYEASVTHTPKAAIFLQKSFNPNDAYMDLKVSPPYNNTGYLIEHYSTGPRSYSTRTIAPPEDGDVDEAMGEYDACNAALKALEEASAGASETPTAEITQVGIACGTNDAMEAMKDTGPKSPEEAVNKLEEAINSYYCAGGGCFPMPYNKAFLVPDGNPLTPRTPVFAFPTTGPLSIPVPSFFGVFPGSTLFIPGSVNSTIRFYMSPTLTGGIGLGLCWGLDQGGFPAPPPLPSFLPYPPPIGNCLAFALPMGALPICKKMAELMAKLMKFSNNVVSDVKSGIASVNGNAGLPVSIDTTKQQGAGGLEVSMALNLGGASKFEPPPKTVSNIHISAFDSIGNVIASWVDRQYQEILNKLLALPTFYMILPDTKAIFSPNTEALEASVKHMATFYDRDTLKKNAEGFTGKDFFGASAGETAKSLWSGPGSTTDKTLPWLGTMESEVANFRNPLEELYAVVNNIPFFKVQERHMEMKVPWLSTAEIDDYIRHLQLWVAHIKREFERVEELWAKFTCPVSDKEWEKMTPMEGFQQKGACATKFIADRALLDVSRTIRSAEQNIEILQSYFTYPRKVVAFQKQLADYIRGLGCYLDAVSIMLGGWISNVREGVVNWIEAIYTIIAVIENIQEMVDLFVSFNDDCSICTNERNANFGWMTLLGLVLPELPIIKFPRWPDLVFDLSDLNAQVTVDLPIVNFAAEPIQLPRMPFVRLPDIPDASIFVSFPELPLLPRLPELPDLPALPAIPKLNLPNLVPPPPKLPDIGATFEFILPLIEKVLQMWCMIKKALTPIPEGYLHDQIVLLTNRPAYLIPLDILKPQLPNIAVLDLPFDEWKIKTLIYLGIRVKEPYQVLLDTADQFNNFTTNLADVINEGIQKANDKVLKNNLEELNRLVDKWNALIGSVDLSYEVNVESQALEEADQALRQIEGGMQDWTDDNLKRPLENAEQVMMQGVVDGIYNANQTLANSKALGKAYAFLKENKLSWGKPVGEALRNLEDKVRELERNGIPVLPEIDSWINDLKGDGSGNTLEETFEEAEIPAAERALENVEDKIDEGVESYEENFSIPDAIRDIQSMTKEVEKSLAYANENLVDYKVLKERFGVPDYQLPEHETTVDRIKAIKEGLEDYSMEVMNQALMLEEAPDLYSLGKNPPEAQPFIRLATQEEKQNLGENPFYTSATGTAPEIPLPKVEIKPLKQAYKALEDNAPAPQDGVCIGSCLVDPATGTEVQFIPYFEDPKNTTTGFISTGIGNKSHVLYNDGSQLYYKRETSTPAASGNRAPRVPNLLYPLDYFLQIGDTVMPPMEAVDGIKTVLTQNGSSSFEWTTPTNPNVYGYGIEIEHSIRGFDASGQSSPWPDLKVVLLPANPDGSAPEMLADGVPVGFNTLVTSLSDAETAKQKFGMRSVEVKTGVSRIAFPTVGGARITLTENQAVYVEKLEGASTTLKLENGYYHLRMNWFDAQGRLSNTSAHELIAPQIYVPAPEPLAFEREFNIPIFKERRIAASEIFTDLSDSYHYYWDMDQDGEPDPELSDQESYTVIAQTEPKEFSATLIASQNYSDPIFPRHTQTFKVKIYVPKINLEEAPLKENSTVKGSLVPIENASTDLKDIPFSIFRKRWDTWKNLGLLHSGRPNELTLTPEGEYEVPGLVAGPPSDALIYNAVGQVIARVKDPTGQVEILDDRYEAKAVPANITQQTRVAVIEEESQEIVGNVYYVSDGNSDVAILEEGLHSGNVKPFGVTIGDRNPEDKVIAKNLPGSAPSFPGGAAIFNAEAKINIAMISTDGSVRLMQPGTQFVQKNPGALTEDVIFQIQDAQGNALFEVYIATQKAPLMILQEQTWAELLPTFGRATLKAKDWMSALRAAWMPEAHAQEAESSNPSPFSDVAPSDPNYQSILDLYNRRIVEGYANGTFQPNARITRAEFVKIALGATNCVSCTNPTAPQKAKYSPIAPFPDVTLPAWYYFCISIAKELGMITGYGDGQFRPERNISRAEAAAVLLRQSSIQPEAAPEEAYLDVPNGAWYRDYVHTAVKIGLIKQNFGFVFPDEEITRGEFAFMASSLLKIEECTEKDSDKDSMPDPWEMDHNLDPLDPNDGTVDGDVDGLTNAQEYAGGSDPRKPDTDGDGILDGVDRIRDLNGNGIPDDQESPVAGPPPSDSVDETPQDLCPEIPEDYDGIDDKDGCPELIDERLENGVGGRGTYINRGPLCGFLDYEALLMPGDTLMTAITDQETHSILFEQSKEATYEK